MELEQRLKQWSPDEPDQALSSINNNSSVDASGLHSTVCNEFSESEQEVVRVLASLSNSHNSTPFSPLLSPMLRHQEWLLCLLHALLVHCQHFYPNHWWTITSQLLREVNY